jgi:site-specific recombinase XerD
MVQADRLLKQYSVETGRHYKASSLNVYGAILGKLGVLANEAGEDLLTVSATTIAKFLSEQSNVNTVKRYACFLDDLYAYIVKIGMRKESPAYKLRDKYSYPEKGVGIKGFSGDAQASAFLAALPTGQSWKKTRDAALLALCLGTGLKLKEMIYLNQCDLHLERDEPTVVVHHRHVSRAVPIRKEVLPFIERWMKLREEDSTLRRLEECFPATLIGGRLASSTVWRHAQKALKAAGLSDLTHFGVSALRVSYARIEAEEGSTVPLLQHRLGHIRETSTVQLLVHGA